MTKYVNITLDDTSPLITYLTSGGWSRSSSVGCYNDTCTIAHGWTSYLSFTFPEPAIALYFYGIKGAPPLAFFSVCIDCPSNAPDGAFKLHATPPLNSENLLYVQHFSTPGVHNFTLKASPNFQVDRFMLEVPTYSNAPLNAVASAQASAAASQITASVFVYAVFFCVIVNRLLFRSAA
ncbi:hypothetical protein NP233_g1436 [Leucocoprinus birnbaumii]|uniref:Uncharacterized protein n=1 Tax=Leucocoprinus birnbaumii TaxID=56174 RepID=A0AAD5YUU3_9AGAR|nr:hypothetical protein NP233_g1436 [Leucocoprinus birnbaumii]